MRRRELSARPHLRTGDDIVRVDVIRVKGWSARAGSVRQTVLMLGRMSPWRHVFVAVVHFRGLQRRADLLMDAAAVFEGASRVVVDAKRDTRARNTERITLLEVGDDAVVR